MKNNIASLVAVALGLSTSSGATSFTLPRSQHQLSETQKRMHAAWLADAPRRNALAAEIDEWNSKVKRRNQRFVARQLARGRTA